LTDYSTLIDAETWAFIERTNSFYPPDTIDVTVAQQRDAYDRMCRAFFAGYVEGVTAATTAIILADRAIPIRLYRSIRSKNDAVVVYFHGGGFILGGLDSHDDVRAELCQRTGYEVVSVDYRLAPEHRHPSAFDDAVSAFEWAAHKGIRRQGELARGAGAGSRLSACAPHGHTHPRKLLADCRGGCDARARGMACGVKIVAPV
jgi:acetyl esterase